MFTILSNFQIYVKSTALKMLKVWSKSGEQGDDWIKGVANIGGHANFRIVFEGVKGSSYQGDIAIDDISFQDCHPGTSIGNSYLLLFLIVKRNISDTSIREETY